MKKIEKFSNLIQLNAEGLGIKSLDNEIVDYLNTELEEKMQLVLSQAQKYLRISKRKTLKIDDLEHSLKFYNFDSLVGYDSYGMADFEKIDNVKGLWRIKQNVIDIEDYLTKPMAIYPMEPFPHFYWFAIENKRPNIPENFIRNNNQKEIEKNKITEQDLLKKRSNFLIGLDPTPDNMTKININHAINNENKNDKKIIHVIHNISKELQIFFENFQQKFNTVITNSILDIKNPYLVISKDMETTINIIKTNSGIVELTPYLINFFMTTFDNSRNSKVAQYVLYYINAMSLNNYLFIEPYLHQILSLLFSIIFYNFEENKNNNPFIIDNLLKIKGFGIKILSYLLSTISIKYNNIQFQIGNIFNEYLDVDYNNNVALIMTSYSSLEGLKMLGKVFIEKSLKTKDIIYFNKLIQECESDIGIKDKIKELIFYENFDEENFEKLSINPRFCNIDSLFKDDYNGYIKKLKTIILNKYNEVIKILD